MTINITGRDIKVFLFGVLSMFLLSSLLNPSDVKKGFNDGIKAYKEDKADREK